MSDLPTLTPQQADTLAEKVLTHCVESGVLTDRALGTSWDEFHHLRARLTGSVDIPMTSLTPLLARVLFAVGGAARPARVAVLGSYAGNLMMFLTAQGFGPGAAYDGRLALGVDVDESAVALARNNLASAGYHNALMCAADAFDAEALARPSGPFDALLIDIDDPVERKGGYTRLARRWLPHLAPGALVLAHDVVHPRFTPGMREYLDFVEGPEFAATTTLPIDACGISISVLAQ